MVFKVNEGDEVPPDKVVVVLPEIIVNVLPKTPTELTLESIIRLVELLLALTYNNEAL